MFEYVLIFITFVLFVISVKEVGFLPFPTILILFLAVSQVMSVLIFQGILPYDMHAYLYNYGGLQANFTTVHIIYTSTAAAALVSLLGKFKALRSLDLTGTLGQLLNAKYRFLSSLIVILLCSVHFVLFLLVSDWNKLWLYQVYLDVGSDAEWVAIFGDQFSDTILRAGGPVAILSCLCVCRLIGTRHTILKFFASALTIFYFLILLSQHSRAAAFFPLLLAINFAILRLKGRRFLIPILAFVAAIAFMSALLGRGTDRHGLSALPETILRPFNSSNLFYDTTQALMDFCQGIVVTAEALQVTGDFDPWYKILAFSPLPSFIDGYSEIRDVSEHRLHEYVPMSGIGEVSHFGWLYISLLLIGFFVLIRQHTRIATYNPAIFILCNFLIMISIYVLFAYPLRNALRVYWLTVALFVAADFARRRSLNDRHRKLRQRNEQRSRMARRIDLSSANSSE
jgi:hypothetical protein